MNQNNLDSKQLQAVKTIRTFLNQHGRMPSVRELMASLDYKSPRSAAVMYEKLENLKIVFRSAEGKLSFNPAGLVQENSQQTIEIPFIGITSCGGPVFAEENIEAYYKVSTEMVPVASQCFFLRAEGGSMNLAGIEDGAMVLIKQQNTAQAGDFVLALIDDEATIKKYRPEAGMVILEPCSSNPIHKPIILTQNFIIQGIVMKSFSGIT